MSTLRALAPGDAELLFEWRTHPDVSRFMYTSGPTSRSEHDAWFSSAMHDSPRRRYRLLVNAGVPAGFASFSEIDPSLHRSCTWGGYIAPDSQGAGLGTALLESSLRLAFEELALERVWIEAVVSNARAIKLYEKAGFTREAYFRSFIWKDGEPVDVVGLSLLRQEWCSSQTRRHSSQTVTPDER